LTEAGKLFQMTDLTTVTTCSANHLLLTFPRYLLTLSLSCTVSIYSNILTGNGEYYNLICAYCPLRLSLSVSNKFSMENNIKKRLSCGEKTLCNKLSSFV